MKEKDTRHKLKALRGHKDLNKGKHVINYKSITATIVGNYTFCFMHDLRVIYLKKNKLLM